MNQTLVYLLRPAPFGVVLGLLLLALLAVHVLVPAVPIGVGLRLAVARLDLRRRWDCSLRREEPY